MRKLLLVGVAMCSSVSANAATVVCNFDDLVDQVPVPGAYCGAAWSGFTTAANFGGTSAPNIAYTSSPVGILDYSAGFTSLAFSAGVFAPGTFSVYSGLGGTGTLLGSLTIGNPPANPFAFFSTGVTFAGVGKSVLVSGGEGSIGWDDVTLGVGAVPEPTTWAMMLIGFGFIGAALRSAKRNPKITVSYA